MIITLTSIALITTAVLVPLFVTGVIPVRRKDSTVRRISYDPLYYGNLHPYLFPSERIELGLETDADVIVIGAGIAGLAAAKTLQDEGDLKVLVLEARVRIDIYWSILLVLISVAYN